MHSLSGSGTHCARPYIENTVVVDPCEDPLSKAFLPADPEGQNRFTTSNGWPSTHLAIHLRSKAVALSGSSKIVSSSSSSSKYTVPGATEVMSMLDSEPLDVETENWAGVACWALVVLSVAATLLSSSSDDELSPALDLRFLRSISSSSSTLILISLDILRYRNVCSCVRYPYFNSQATASRYKSLWSLLGMMVLIGRGLLDEEEINDRKFESGGRFGNCCLNSVESL
ncbi:hypothetical protein OGAPHI_003633 [Ogataea philodendri]|uniref:Uncharacterized protein n=1 Tax=Ogataea philodendri TaxID=1378263 RepID=A0A9P8T4P0_9ASCO|nr:uncharacterized protein OGAPHI_003633 [Ogataea philodendri]KAH3665449.1 hypothetical protein OGAPHI_003633 [Ogataea philodendri]